MIYRFTTATLLAAQGAAAGRQLESCETAQIATCFDNVGNGASSDIDLVPGTMNTWDGINSYTQLYLGSKEVFIACSEDGGGCVWQGATGKRVVKINDNGGTSSLRGLTIKDGDAGGDGAGLYVTNSNVGLIIVAFIGNAAGAGGGAIYADTSGSVILSLKGCSFAGNTAGSNGPDVYNNGQDVIIAGCPTGEDNPRLRPTRPSPPFVPSQIKYPLTPLTPSPLFPPLPPPPPPSPLLSSQVMLQPKVPN